LKTALSLVSPRMAGMSGLEHHHKIPRIFITARGDEKMRMQALRSGAVKFLTKPLDNRVLLDSVRTALDA
jgi:FixJ family two-component response regulator